MTFTNLIVILCCFVVMAYSIKIIVNSYNPKAAVYVNMYSIYYIFLLSTLLFASACNSYIETMSAGSSSGVPSTKSPDGYPPKSPDGVTVQPNSLLNSEAQKQSADLTSEDEQKLKNDEAAQANTLTTPVSPIPGPINPGQPGSGPINPGQPGSGPINPGQPGSGPINPGQPGSGSLNPVPLNPVPLNPVPLNPGQLNPVPLNPGQLNPDLSSGPINPVQLNPGQLNPDLSSGPINPVQLNPGQPVPGQPSSGPINHEPQTNTRVDIAINNLTKAGEDNSEAQLKLQNATDINSRNPSAENQQALDEAKAKLEETRQALGAAQAEVEAATTEAQATEAQAAARPSQSTEVEAAIAMQTEVENASEKVKNAKEIFNKNSNDENKKALKSAENDLTKIILDHMLKEVSQTDDQSQREPTDAEKQLEVAIQTMKDAIETNNESNIDELQEQLNAAVELVYTKRTEEVKTAEILTKSITASDQVKLAEAEEKEAEAKLKEAQMAFAQAILVLQFAEVAHHNGKPNSKEYLEEAQKKDEETGAAVRKAIEYLENARAVTLAAKENLTPKSETVEPVKVPQENVEELEAKVEELKAKVEVLKAKVETTRGSIPDNTSNPEYDSNLNNHTQALEELKKAKEELEKAEKELTLQKAIKEQNELKPQEQESTPGDDFKETFEKAFEHATAANKKKEETQQNLSNAQKELSQVRQTIKYDSNEQTIQLYDNKSNELNIAFEAAKKAGQESYTAFKTLNELIQKYDKQPKYKQSEEEQSKNRELHDKAGDILNKLDELNKQSTTLYENINDENMVLSQYIGKKDDTSKQKFKETIEKIKNLNNEFATIQQNINDLDAELSQLFPSENDFKQQ